MAEVEIHGEGSRQDVLERIAGPKDEDGKQLLVGVVLRCEPTNGFDPNAVRVEVMGQQVGYVAKEQAALLSPPMVERCGGVIEGRGVIVGGWKHARPDPNWPELPLEGHYGIRAWVGSDTLGRLGVHPGDIDLSLRPAWPPLPPVQPGERRILPASTGSTEYFDSVTVTCEEHYQPTILASMPPGWEQGWSWPVLVELRRADANPHAKTPATCVEVVAGATVGYLTARMSERYVPLVNECWSAGDRATAEGAVYVGEKGGAPIHRLKVQLPKVR
jgi:hypothetical protein